MSLITGDQCRAARAFLDWSRERLAKEAGISHGTVVAFERSARGSHHLSINAIRSALEAAGIEFRGVGCVCLRVEDQASEMACSPAIKPTS